MSGVEYRVLIERPDLHPPHAFLTTTMRELAELEVRQQRQRYCESEPRTRVWAERRQVGPWEALA